MLRHYYTLKKVCDELQLLINSKVTEIFSQQKNSVYFEFYDGDKLAYIEYSADNELGTLFLHRNFNRAKKNTISLFTRLNGETLKNVTLDDNDRIIRFKFSRFELCLMLFGGSNSNALLLDKNSVVIDSFKRKKQYSGDPFSPIRLIPKKLFEFPKDTKIIEALSKCDINFGKYYAKELCYRLNINPSLKLEDISLEEIDKLAAEAEKLKQECLNSQEFYVLKNNTGEYLLSLILLTDYPDTIFTSDSISEAIRRRAAYTYKIKHYQTARQSITSLINSLKRKLEKKISYIKNDELNSSNIDKYRKYGDLLSSQPNPKIKHENPIKLMDWEGNELEIKLNPMLTLLENSAVYYEKSKDLKEHYKRQLSMLPRLENNLNFIKEMELKLDKAENEKEIKSLNDELKNKLGAKILQNEENAATKYKIFDLGEGFTLYVGKNAANNDELTMKFAKPNDLWFHARGSSGSHAVLPLNKEQKAPKQIIAKAASIAAYYSGARKAKYVPVCYAFKKYVRKPKGANPGSVVIAREEVIMVEPRLPEGTEAEG
jgi:predicted ribosome quality control (RQC) complex YloA/Tae2 family protein